MCGICGVLGKQISDLSIVERMIRAIKHRGPDGEGYYHSQHISLGACLLSILDNEKGQQPIFNEDKSACIVFNGEIYNFQLLREELVNEGHIFYSNSDAEVVLHLFEEYQEDCVNYLEGMFAFAIWDGNKLFLARDRMGIKPLFYSYLPENQQFIFASEVKAILEHPDINSEVNEKSLCELQVLGFILSQGITLEKNVKQLAPGSILEIADSNSAIEFKEKTYSVLNPLGEDILRNAVLNEQSICEDLESALRESCRAIVRHDNLPKAIYLSGGLDSSLIAILCAEESLSPIHTFTLADSVESEDIRYARKVAKAIGSIHHEILVDDNEYIEEYPKFLEAYENIPTEGTFDLGGEFAFFLASKHISKCVKVAICGEGADELFGGYWMHRWPLGYADFIFDRLSNVSLGKEKCELMMDLQKWFPTEEDREIYQYSVFDLLLGSGLSNYHLWAVDRTSMWYGLEVRVPYLHDRVVKLATSLPVSLKIKGSTTKHILRKVAEKLFDKYSLLDILNRPKWAMPDALKNIKAMINQDIKTRVAVNEP